MESNDEISTIDVNAFKKCSTILETEKSLTSESQDILQSLIETVDVDTSMSGFEATMGLTCKDNLLNFNGKEELNTDVLLNGIDRFIYGGTCNGKSSSFYNNNVKQEKNKNKIDEVVVIRKGQHYKDSFKRKVLNYAVKHTFRETATKFHINPNTLTEWAREYKRLLLLKKEGRSNGLTEQETSDVKFLKWVREQREAAKLLTRQEVLQVGLQCLHLDVEAPTWFRSWLNRLSDDSNETTRQHIKYPANFKLEVALFAKEFREKAAASTFKVSTRRIYEWCEHIGKPSTISVVADKRNKIDQELLDWMRERIADGSTPKNEEIMAKARILYSACGMGHVKCSKGWMEKVKKRLDINLNFAWDDLLLWILQQLDNNKSITLSMVENKAREVALRHKKAFKGSKCWTLRFLKQHSHILQNSSARVNDLPQSAVDSAHQFIENVRNQYKKFPYGSIGCMDEIPIKFAFPREKVKTPNLLRQAGFESAQAVVLLAATCDGHLLQPAVVLKGSNSSKTIQMHNSSPLVWRRKSMELDSNLIQEWADNIWLPEMVSPSTLILDSYNPHISPLLNENLMKLGCALKIIPSGCANFLQPFAFNLSRRFQEVVQEAWIEYASKEEKLTGNIKLTCPPDSLILSWIARAHQVLQADSNSIRNSFIITGLITSDV